MEIRDRVVELRRVSGRELLANPKNYRKHGDAQRKALAGILERVGIAGAVLARETPAGLELIDGHLRAEDNPDAQWPVLILDVTEAEADLILATHDPLAAMAETDSDLLRGLIEGLDDGAALLAKAAQSESALLKMLQAGEGLTDPDDVPEAEPGEPITQPGDLWILGAHRLLCGDSTDAENWDRLKIPKKGAACFTSPPYNLGGSMKLSNNKKRAAAGNAYDEHDDAQTPEKWRALCDASLSCALAKCEAVAFNLQPLAGNRREILKFLASRDEYRDVATWDKVCAAPAMAPGVMNAQFEWIAIFGRGKASRAIPLAKWRGNVANVYTGLRQSSNEFFAVHGATFPVHLPLWVLGKLFDGATSVVDCFAGTGTTLIAAEQLGRPSYSIEISPAYCDIAVARWEKFTGKTATRTPAIA